MVEERSMNYPSLSDKSEQEVCQIIIELSDTLFYQFPFLWFGIQYTWLYDTFQNFAASNV